MALPKIETPTYELTLPSTGETISYRPFLVKEQKILLMASENPDTKSQVNAVKQIMKNCILDDITPNNLPLFDIEYIFLNLRSKSVGEIVDIILPCKDTECKGQTPHQIDLSAIGITKNEKHTNKVILTDEIGLIMKYPTIQMMNKFNLEDSNSLNLDLDSLVNVVASCIESIYDNDNVYDPKESTQKELFEYVSNFSQEQFERVQEFFDTMPKVQTTITTVCPECKKEHEQTVEGIGNFFG